MKNRFAFFALTLAAGLFQNCAVDKGVPTLGSPGPGPTQNQGRSTSDGNYFLIQSGYSCGTQIGTTVTKNWSDKIIIQGSDVTFRGDYCNDALAVSPLAGSGVQISSDNLSLNYNGKTYEFRETEP